MSFPSRELTFPLQGYTPLHRAAMEGQCAVLVCVQVV
jgi:hypothetical protein